MNNLMDNLMITLIIKMYQTIHPFLNNPDLYIEHNIVSSPKPHKPSNPTWQYYLKGAFAGMTGILLSHPLDTVKTHIQTGHALRDFTPGLRNLYRGLLPPLLGVGLEKAVVFGTYNYFNKKPKEIIVKA